MGKRKIAIEEIKDDRQRRSVTFTKRRDGLFKKAETASLKFGLQIGIIAFSPAGKPFTFTNSSSSLSLDQIIHTYNNMSSSSTSTSSSSSAVVMGKRRRSRSDDDDVQVIETEKKKKKQKTMNAVVTPPLVTVQEEEDEKLDQGFHWDHYQNLDSDQTPHDHDQDELTNEFIMGYGENAIVTEEVINMESSSQLFLIEGESSHSWAPDVQEIINIEDDDFEYDNGIVTEEESSQLFLVEGGSSSSSYSLLPPPATTPTATSTMGFCDLLLSASESDTNNDEEDYGYTLEEWEQILSTSPTTVVAHTSSYMNALNQEEEEVEADNNWPTQEFVQHLCS